MIRAATIALLGVTAFAQWTVAQSFNIDFGDDLGVPCARYGAAALPGFWNNHNGSPGAEALLDLQGLPTSVTAKFTPIVPPPFPNKWSFGYNHPGTTGDDERLYDDAIGGLGGIVGSIAFVGLEPGVYDVYTHAWVPQDPNNVLWVWVKEGLAEFQELGGDWPGVPEFGATYALHDRVHHRTGSLAVHLVRGRVIPTTDYWLNGLQLVKIGDLCYPDCDQSTGAGVLDIFDFLCFQEEFVKGEPYACDCDLSTGVGVCDIFDFLCFQNAFVGGCP